jgi:hypothetical protein
MLMWLLKALDGYKTSIEVLEPNIILVCTYVASQSLMVVLVYN